MAHLHLSIMMAAALSVAGTAALGQDTPAANEASAPLPAPVAKTPVRKRASSVQPLGRTATSTTKATTLGNDKATRLEEGRKKFFGQSSGFDNGRDLPLSTGGSDGNFKPSMGFKF